MKTLTINNVVIGQGAPKIIVPVVGTDAAGVLTSIEQAVAAGADCIEWRADFCPEVAEAGTSEAALDVAVSWLDDGLPAVHMAAQELPVLFTIRTASQGGNSGVTGKTYATLVECAIKSGYVDLVDIEINQGDLITKSLLRLAKERQVVSVASYHNFRETPSVEWMVSTLVRMHDLGADIPKLAVMPQNKQDTLRLLAATNKVVEERDISPVITMAMGADGVTSRLMGEAFGSAMTFASLEEASAPGQVGLTQTQAAIQAIHEAIS